MRFSLQFRRLEPDPQAQKDPADRVAEGSEEYQRGQPPEWHRAKERLEVVWRETYAGAASLRWMPGSDRAVYYKRTIEGACPRCGHAITKDISPESSKKVVLARLKKVRNPDEDGSPQAYYQVECNCVHQHEGVEKGVYGCGAIGGISAAMYPSRLKNPERENGELVVRQPVTPIELTAELAAADEWIEDARRDSLPRARTVAQQWVNVFTAVSGIVALGAVWESDDVLGSLGPRYPWFYLAFALAALVFAVFSIYFGQSAAGLREVTGVSPDVRERLGLRQSLVFLTRRYIRISQIFAFGALVALGLAFSVRYVVPLLDDTPQITKVKIVGVETASPKATPTPGQ